MCDKVSAQNLPGAARPPRAPAFVCEKVRRQLNPDTVGTRDTSRKRAPTCDQPGYRPVSKHWPDARSPRASRGRLTHTGGPNPNTPIRPRYIKSAPMPICSRDQPPRAPPRVRSQHCAPRWSDRRLRGHPLWNVCPSWQLAYPSRWRRKRRVYLHPLPQAAGSRVEPAFKLRAGEAQTWLRRLRGRLLRRPGPQTRPDQGDRGRPRTRPRPH